MVRKLTASPSPARPLVDERGIMSEQTRLWAQSITDAQRIIGSGSPDGIVEANQGVFYIDEDAALGSVLYVKQRDNVAGDRKFGWVLIG